MKALVIICRVCTFALAFIGWSCLLVGVVERLRTVEPEWAFITLKSLAVVGIIGLLVAVILAASLDGPAEPREGAK